MDEHTDTATPTDKASDKTKPPSSKRGVFWILAGLVVTGIAAGYKWLKDLPRD